MPGEPAPQLDTSVGESLGRYPRARDVLVRRGRVCCAWSAGSGETWARVAAMHRKDAQGLLAELRAAIGRSGTRRRVPVARGQRRDMYRLFVITALLLGLTGGFTLGAGLVLGYASQTWVRAWVGHAQVHGHVQVWGWTLLFGAGVLAHVLPRLKAAPAPNRPVLAAVYVLLVSGLLARAVGQPLADQPLFATLFLVAGPLELAGVSLFLMVIHRIRRRSVQPREPFDGYLSAALRWAWLGTALEAWASVNAARAGAALVSGGWHDAAMVAMLWGFAVLLIGGFSVRVVPIFLRLPPPRLGAVHVALTALDLGVALSAAGPLSVAAGISGLASPLAAAGALALALGAASLAHGLHLGPVGQLRTPLVPGTAHLAAFVRAAYLWLPVAAAIDLAQAAAGLFGAAPGYFALSGGRHALTLGFITMMIYGLAARLLAAFSGHPWYSTRLLWVSFATLNASVVLRTVLQPTLGYAGATWPLAFGAVLGLVSFVIFALNALLTLAGRAGARPREGTVG